MFVWFFFYILRVRQLPFASAHAKLLIIFLESEEARQHRYTPRTTECQRLQSLSARKRHSSTDH